MNNKKIAVFFDCENISSRYTSDIFDELANYGEVTIRQAYIDWGSDQSKKWKDQISKFAIKQIQTTSNTKSKNVSDFQIVIDVMNTMHNSNIDIIVLVSSDSDFTSLAIEIKSKGFEVYGFGEKKTPDSLRNAYSIFIELPTNNKPSPYKEDKLLLLLKDAVDKTKADNGYALISQVGNYLIRKNASLNAKNHGANTWGDIFKRYSDDFNIDYQDTKKSKIMVKIK